jgi:hypothetical protein
MKRNKLGKNVGNLAIRQVGKGFICVYGEDSHDEANSRNLWPVSQTTSLRITVQ